MLLFFPTHFGAKISLFGQILVLFIIYMYTWKCHLNNYVNQCANKADTKGCPNDCTLREPWYQGIDNKDNDEFEVSPEYNLNFSRASHLKDILFAWLCATIYPAATFWYFEHLCHYEISNSKWFQYNFFLLEILLL